MTNPTMHRSVKSLILLSLTSLPIASMIFLLSPKPSYAAGFCQCVEYVKNRFGITAPVGNAKDMVNTLPRFGFTRISEPQAGAVVVMQPSFPGSDPTYGHVGIVEGVQYVNGQTKISVRSSNQIGSKFSDANCSNVTVIGFGTAVNGRSDIAFLQKGSVTQSSSFRAVNFSARAASIGVNIRTAPSISASIVRRTGGNESLNFDGWQYSESVPDLWTNQPDRRWYRIAGTNNWVASAVVLGNAPGSQP